MAKRYIHTYMQAVGHKYRQTMTAYTDEKKAREDHMLLGGILEVCEVKGAIIGKRADKIVLDGIV